uniref:Uncharacterized protein n=1 Tax=Oryza meridionalis TaxID=40149 RepID=A0A0E0C1E3_9ORYZ
APENEKGGRRPRPLQRRREVLDLEEQFAFFRSQHRHLVNAAAHALLVWPILFTNLLILPSPLALALTEPTLPRTSPSTAVPARSRGSSSPLAGPPAAPSPRASGSRLPGTGRPCSPRSSCFVIKVSGEEKAEEEARRRKEARRQKADKAEAEGARAIWRWIVKR